MRATLPLVPSPLVGGFCLLMPSLPFFLALLDTAPLPAVAPLLFVVFLLWRWSPFPHLFRRGSPPPLPFPPHSSSFLWAPHPPFRFSSTDLGLGLGCRVRVGLGLSLGLLVVWSQSGPPQAVRLPSSQMPTACPNPVGVLVGAASVVRIYSCYLLL